MKPIRFNDGVHDGLGVHGYFCPICDYNITGWWQSSKVTNDMIKTIERCPRCGAVNELAGDAR